MALFGAQANASKEHKKYTKPIRDPHRIFNLWTVYYVKEKACGRKDSLSRKLSTIKDQVKVY